MVKQYHSELKEKPKFEATAHFNAFISKWAVRTHEELKGRGISFYQIDSEGRNFYYVTPKAFEKLEKQINISQELLFD